MIFHYQDLHKALLNGIMNVRNGFYIREASDLLNRMMDVWDSEIKVTQGMRIIYDSQETFLMFVGTASFAIWYQGFLMMLVLSCPILSYLDFWFCDGNYKGTESCLWNVFVFVLSVSFIQPVIRAPTRTKKAAILPCLHNVLYLQFFGNYCSLPERIQYLD